MGLFGWSLPPGCGTLPGEEPVPPCPICGLDVELNEDKGGCTCKACPTCGEYSCLDHIPQTELQALFERHVYISGELEGELKRRYERNPTICHYCKQPMSFDLAQCQEGMPYHHECEQKHINEMEQM